MEKIKAYCVAPLDGAEEQDVGLGVGGNGNSPIAKSKSVSHRESASETRKGSRLYRVVH